MTDALHATSAKVVYICNVANQRGETGGMDAADHVAALVAHGLDDVIDVAVIHDTDAHPLGGGGVQPVAGGSPEAARIRELGVEVLLADLVDLDDPRHHSRRRLLAVLEGLV